MHGKIIKFKGDISNFKVKDGVVKNSISCRYSRCGIGSIERNFKRSIDD